MGMLVNSYLFDEWTWLGVGGGEVVNPFILPVDLRSLLFE